MKSLSIAAFALVLALSGCTSSPSNGDRVDTSEQRKLIQYENCLKYYIESHNRITETVEGSPGIFKDITTVYQYEKTLSYGQILDACLDYRP